MIGFDWLNAKWDEIIGWLHQIWDSVVEFFTELPLLILDSALNAIASLIESIPVPDFLSSGLQSLLSAIDPSVLFFLSQSGFAAALAILGSGFSFRMLRKLFTLGQW